MSNAKLNGMSVTRQQQHQFVSLFTPCRSYLAHLTRVYWVCELMVMSQVVLPFLFFFLPILSAIFDLLKVWASFKFMSWVCVWPNRSSKVIERSSFIIICKSSANPLWIVLHAIRHFTDASQIFTISHRHAWNYKMTHTRVIHREMSNYCLICDNW